MGLFGRNKKEEEKVEAPKGASAPSKSAQGRSASGGKAPAPKPAASPAPAVSLPANLARVLKNPRITEKATSAQASGVYAFDISEGVSKRQIIEAVRAIYRVTPRKVAVVRVPQKVRRSMRTGKTGISKGGRKAYVYLKRGETITIH